MRTFLFYAICTVLLLIFAALIKVVVTGVSADFGYGFVAGGALIVVLGIVAEKLGYKEPRY